MSEQPRVDYINHALSEMSSRVREVYCQQVADFEKSIADTELRNATTKAIIAEHQRLCRNYRNRVYEIINRPVPDTLDLAVRNESAKSSWLCDFAGPLPNFYSKESPLRVYVGKEIYYLFTSLILLENGFFDRRRRQHGDLVDKYIGRSEVIADRWQAAGLGPIATGQPYEFKEIDLATAYFKTIHSLYLGPVGFDSIKQFVRKTIDPAAFVKQFEYDIFVVREAKTFLQEYMQVVYKITPTYSIEKQDNRPEHDPLFLASIDIPRVGRVEEFGRSKYEATMLTAESAIGILRAQKIPQFLRFEERQIATVYEFGRPTQEWRPRPKQLERAARWKRDVNFPFRVSDIDVLKCFSTGASKELGACPQDNGLRAQIGSHIINVAALTPDSSAEDRQRMKIVTEYLERIYEIGHGEESIFGGAPIHGSVYTTDIIQSLVFTGFLAMPDQVMDTMTKLSEDALRPYSNLAANAQTTDKHNLSIVTSTAFDPIIAYTQFLQNYTQSQLNRGRPEFTIVLDGRPHLDPTHRAICSYRGLSTKGEGRTVKIARNVAAYKMLKSLASQADE